MQSSFSSQSKYLLIVGIIGFLLPSFFVMGDSFGDDIKTRTPSFSHTDLKDQDERNAQQTPHDNSIKWKKGQDEIPYTVDEKWNFLNNNLMAGEFTRTWNHTITDHENQKFNGTMHNWWTGLTLYRVGEIDTVSGTYEMDFFYWIQIFEDNDPANFKQIEPDVDFVNAVDYEIEAAKGIIQKPHYYEADIKGVFYTDMDFQKFPFEKLNLEIIIEPWINDASYSSLSDSIQFQLWPFRALEPNTSSPGYEIVGYDVVVEDVPYSEGDTFSRYKATFEIQREFVGSILKFIAPILLMSGLAMAALIFPSEEYMTKIELNAIFLLGILFYVQVVSEEIPTTGEMTIFDIIVMMSYSIIVVTMIIPAAKWKKRKVYEINMYRREKWDDFLEEKKDSIHSEITFLSIRLNAVKSEDEKHTIIEKVNDQEKALRQIKHDEIPKDEEIIEVFGVDKKDIKKIEEMKESITKKDAIEFRNLRESNKKFNYVAWASIGIIFVTTSVTIMSI